jgi:hypothetical protein
MMSLLKAPCLSTLILSTLILAVCLCACEGAVGDQCSTSSDCPIGTACDRNSSGGYCLSYNCRSTDECLEGATCVQFTPSTSYCLKKCKKKSDCRSGYTCRDDIGDTKFCYVAADAPYGRDPNNEIPFDVPTDPDDTNEENPNPESPTEYRPNAKI